MAISPKKIAVIVCGGNFWEIVFCFLHIENKGMLRLPITISSTQKQKTDGKLEAELAKLSLVSLSDIKATSVDGLIIPGSKVLFESLCNFEREREVFTVDEGLKKLLKGVYRLDKPIGAFGPASVMLVKALQGITKSTLVVTAGNDPVLQSAIEFSGAQAVTVAPGEVIYDEQNKVLTSGGEFVFKRISEVYDACESLVGGMTDLIKR